MKVNNYGYLERNTRSGIKGTKSSKRIWWLIKCNSNGRAMANVGELKVYFPQRDIGRKVRFKADIYD